MISRRLLTDALITAVSTATGFPVGDADHPDPPYGWSGQSGAPGSTFSPYSILTPQNSSQSSGPLSDTQGDWHLTYTIASFGTNRTQCEWICDLARSAFSSLKKETFESGSDTYQIMQVRTENIGGVVRSDAVEPATFGQTDVISVWVTKEL